jgi:hypothetical protein
MIPDQVRRVGRKPLSPAAHRRTPHSDRAFHPLIPPAATRKYHMEAWHPHEPSTRGGAARSRISPGNEDCYCRFDVDGEYASNSGGARLTWSRSSIIIEAEHGSRCPSRTISKTRIGCPQSERQSARARDWRALRPYYRHPQWPPINQRRHRSKAWPILRKQPSVLDRSSRPARHRLGRTHARQGNCEARAAGGRSLSRAAQIPLNRGHSRYGMPGTFTRIL